MLPGRPGATNTSPSAGAAAFVAFGSAVSVTVVLHFVGSTMRRQWQPIGCSAGSRQTMSSLVVHGTYVVVGRVGPKVPRAGHCERPPEVMDFTGTEVRSRRMSKSDRDLRPT